MNCQFEKSARKQWWILAIEAILLFILYPLLMQGQYATGGLGAYQDEIYWINWSGVNSIHNGLTVTRTLPSGAVFNAEFSNVVKHSGDIEAYNTGSWTGDKLDDYYSGVNPIGLVNTNSGGDVEFSLSFAVTLDGDTVPYHLIMADAEDNNSNEYFLATTDGEDWQVLEIMPSSNDSRPLTDQNLDFSDSDKTIKQWFAPGATYIPGGIYVSQNATELDVRIKGSGKSAIAIGAYLPFDYNDVIGYGDATHLIEIDYLGGYNPYPGTDTTYTLADLTEASMQPVELSIGTAIDAERDSMATPAADGDGADDDGTSFHLYDKSGNYDLDVTVTNNTGSDAYLRGWIDFNDDGDFDEAYDESALETISGNGTYTLNFSGIPTNIPVNGFTAARLRLSSVASEVDEPTGLASIGEVEDYLLSESVILSKMGFNWIDALPVDERIELSWEMEGLVPAGEFRVERSGDGEQWTPIGEEPAENGMAHDYTDWEPLLGANYYRLVHLFEGEEICHSEVSVADYQPPLMWSSGHELRIFPNPASAEVTISSESGIGCYRMIQLARGKLVRLDCSKGGNEIKIDIGSETPGFYQLELHDPSGQLVGSERLQIHR